jgi:hypothetical protein
MAIDTSLPLHGLGRALLNTYINGVSAEGRVRSHFIQRRMRLTLNGGWYQLYGKMIITRQSNGRRLILLLLLLLLIIIREFSYNEDVITHSNETARRSDKWWIHDNQM